MDTRTLVRNRQVADALTRATGSLGVAGKGEAAGRPGASRWRPAASKWVPQATRSDDHRTYRCYLRGPDGIRELSPCGPGARRKLPGPRGEVNARGAHRQGSVSERTDHRRIEGARHADVPNVAGEPALILPIPHAYAENRKWSLVMTVGRLRPGVSSQASPFTVRRVATVPASVHP